MNAKKQTDLSVSKDMQACETNPKKCSSYRLNTELGAELGEQVEAHLEVYRLKRTKWVRALISGHLNKKSSSQIFDAVLNDRFRADRQRILDDALYVLSLMRVEPFLFPANAPLEDHVRGVLASEIINEIQEKLKVILLHVAKMEICAKQAPKPRKGEKTSYMSPGAEQKDAI